MGPISGERSDFKNCFSVEFTKNYRVKDDEFLRRLNILRNLIGTARDEVINYKAHELFIDRKGDINMFDPKKDILLCSTHDVIEEMNDILLGLGHTPRWRVKSGQVCIFEEKNYTSGEIIFSVKKPPKCVLAFGNTIHAFQGKTIKNGKIFIKFKNLFLKEMIYTMLSRGERLEQVVII